MSENNSNEPMMDMFIFETSQLIEKLEQSILASEKEKHISEADINEIFRIMHTIKGSASMMMFNGISRLSHSIEDLFSFIREQKPVKIDYSKLSDLVLEGVDFTKVEMEKLKNGDNADGNADSIIDTVKNYLAGLKKENNYTAPVKGKSKDRQNQDFPVVQNSAGKGKYAFKAVIFFEEGCEMENIRAYTIIHNLQNIASDIFYIPDDILDDDESAEVIRKNGFKLYFKTDLDYEKINGLLQQIIFLKDLELVQLENDSEFGQFIQKSTNAVKEDGTFNDNGKVKEASSVTDSNIGKEDVSVKEDSAINGNGEVKENNATVMNIKATEGNSKTEEKNIQREDTDASGQEKEHPDMLNNMHSAVQSIISVNVVKLDKLMDLVGEMVISEAMVVQNPDLAGLDLNNFKKAARQLNKITGEIQDTVMSIRMVPLSVTFQKMHRIVRDMCKKLKKEAKLVTIGENTEVDKNIIEHIADPLMHLVRNAVDHGIESPDERIAKGKPGEGTVTLEAKNAGSDVLIIVKDDGAGLDRQKILKKAREKNLLFKNENEISDKEAFGYILLPGFSTNDKVSEYSGRGVGMDVVSKNIEAIGGSVSIDSSAGRGTVITLKIPLTLAIINGMNIKVGNSCYTLPINSIRESFRPKEKDIITDPDGDEMIMVRGKCYPILRLHRRFDVKTEITDLTRGIIIMVEQDEKCLCIFADELLGQQQVVVKALPEFIKRYKKIKGLTGCTLLGDGSISLILDVAGLINS